MKQTLHNKLLGAGFQITRTGQPDGVRELLQSLHPVQSRRPLIRLGDEGDGGYLVPDELDGIEYCFSPGVDVKAGFELALANKGIRSFLADASVAGSPVSHELIEFDAHHVGAIDTPTSLSMDTWMQKKLGDTASDNLLLQMDIEGHEYATLLAMPEKRLQQFKVIVIEFHHLHKLFDPAMFPILKSCFDKLLQNFSVVHLHPNNLTGTATLAGVCVPRLMEFTFARHDLVDQNQPVTRFPHPLDRDCVTGQPGLALPACWHATSN